MKPSIHDLISVGSMEVDGQTNNNENVHGIVVTPEIANMMSTPTQIGKEFAGFLMCLFFFISFSSLSHTEIHNSNETNDDGKMQTDQNGHQLQYITLGNNNIPTSTATTPTNDSKGNNSGPKTWTPSDMEAALDALRTHNMSLTKASATYGIPSTTLWQRAHRLGIGKFISVRSN